MVNLVEEGHSLEEIASVMRCSVKAVWSNVRPHIKFKEAHAKTLNTELARMVRQELPKTSLVINLPLDRKKAVNPKNITFPIRYSINEKTKIVHFTSIKQWDYIKNNYKALCGWDVESRNLISTDIDIMKICENDRMCKKCLHELEIQGMYGFIEKIYELYDSLTS